MEEYRVVKDYVAESMELVINDRNETQWMPTSFRKQYAVQVKGFLRWHTVKTFTKIRAAAKFMHSLKQKLKDEI